MLRFSPSNILVRYAILVALLGTFFGPAIHALAAAGAKAKKVVLIAGEVHQGPGGHPPGTHEYELSARLLKHSLDTAANVSDVKVEVHTGGWPRDPRTLDDADTIVVLSDGADRNPQDHPLLVGDRLQAIKKQMERGCGLAAIHWTVFVPQNHGGQEFLEWIGGYFDYESGGAANHWYSKIQTAATSPRPATPDHPICRGVGPFPLREEYYYNIRFRPNDPRLVPILSTSIPGEISDQTVAWAVERAGGGRGFGFTGGHFFDNWGVENFRRMVLNAILWTAHMDVPSGGVQSAAPESDPKVSNSDQLIQTLIVTGHQHPAHDWRATTAALQQAFAPDRRFQLSVVTDPEFLATKNLFGYDTVVLNYCNWQRSGLSEAAKANFQKYLGDGGGLVIVHFSNGAFHASLPDTPNTDWPEFRDICRRVWDHAPGRSGHDPFGRFQVQIAKEHPITHGMNSFETVDELYFNQQGDRPIEVLATAHSKVTLKDEPMAFVHEYVKGRVFQTVLGHSAESLQAPGEAALVRRGAAWTARRPQRAVETEARPEVTAAPRLAPAGRFGAALDPRQGAAWATHKDVYDKRPLSVECWARLASKNGFNILVASNPKESADHWELYSYAGSGELSLYLPGFTPAEIKSGVEITLDQWHHVAAAFDEKTATLFVDGKQVKQVAIARSRSGGPAGPLYFGGYPPGGIGCDGLIDEVRVSNGPRAFDALPAAPLSVDGQTIGLWHFDRVEKGQVEDDSLQHNSAVAGAQAASPPLLTRTLADPALQLITIDTSPDESFLSMRADTTGRLFVGGREALFVYEPLEDGGYGPRQLLYRFPPDSWLTDVEIRGDDLYVMTNAALYVIPRARVERKDLRPKRLLWGTPVDLHVTWHGLAWGPGGDLYFSSGDPLLNYGDFQNRPDHWGHWTIHAADGTQTPYTGVGGFFRCRPDGTNLQVVAGGTRGAVGIAFDRRWNLFSNDNDHESLADRYSPARLLHVAPKAHFFWPRGWIASMSPERSDLLEIVNAGMGREAPVGQTYYDDTLLGESYRDSLLVARWGQRKVDGFKLAPRGASYRADEFPLLVGSELARPVGVGVGRGGRIFAAISYMAGNEWSPKYPSELVMITRKDDPPSFPFKQYDAPTVSADRLWKELADPSWSRRQAAHQEILRRGGDLLMEASRRLQATSAPGPDAVAANHLIWLSAASGRGEALTAIAALLKHADPGVRVQAARALGEFRSLGATSELFAGQLTDSDPGVQHAAVVALFDRDEPLPAALFSGPACSRDTYLRQASAFLIAQRASEEQLNQLLNSQNSAQRLAGVLAAGFRLTVPPAVGPLPENLPLRYESQNAKFVIEYADATIDLKKLGRVGSFTSAQRWKELPRSAPEIALFDALVTRLNDTDERVALQAAYFLNLLDDPKANVLVAEARRNIIERLLGIVTPQKIELAWYLGPLDDGPQGFDKSHSPEQGPIDLSASVVAGNRRLTRWHRVDLPKGIQSVPAAGAASSYLYFRVQALQAGPLKLHVARAMRTALWHNGRRQALRDGSEIVNLEPGSNDFLLRLGHEREPASVTLTYQTAVNVEVVLPEPFGLGSLADRLAGAATRAVDKVPIEFVRVDWRKAVGEGDIARGRKLFGADALGCAKCHAVLPGQKGGGAPSLAGARERFTIPHLIESILVPNKQVAPVFGTTTIITDDGKSVAGLVVEENEDEVVLLMPNTTRQAVPKNKIDERKLQPVSPMPTGLVKTPDELRDLLAYLLSPNPQAP